MVQQDNQAPAAKDDTVAAIPVQHVEPEAPPLSQEQLNRQLRALGADWADLRFPETRAILYVLHPGEQVRGIVYGRYKQDEGRLVGRGVLIATDDRVLLLDKKPSYVKLEEIVYDAISGLTYSRVLFSATIKVHAKSGDIIIRTLNQKTAQPFIEAVEENIYGRSKWKAIM